MFPFLLMLCLCKEEQGGVLSPTLVRPLLGFLFHLHPFVIGLVPCPSCCLAPYHVVLLYKEEQQGAPTPTIIDLCLYLIEVNIPPPIIASFHLHPFVIGLFVYRSSSLFPFR